MSIIDTSNEIECRLRELEGSGKLDAPFNLKDFAILFGLSFVIPVFIAVIGWWL